MKVVRSREPIESAVKALVELLSASTHPTLCLLAGGSWLPVYQALPEDVFGATHTYMCGDERYSIDPGVNNYAQLVATGVVERARRAGSVVLDSTVLPSETHTEYAERLARAYSAWREAYPNGRVIATFGLGEDGHTAGIFAASAAAAVESAPTFLPVTLAPEQNPHLRRVTPSVAFLASEITAAVVLAAGPGKCDALKRVLAANNYDPALPATLWQQLQSVTLVTDCPG